MENLIVHCYISIREALRTIRKCGEKCLIVADENNTLLGILIDGDLRRVILKGASIGDSVAGLYQTKPTVLVEGYFDL